MRTNNGTHWEAIETVDGQWMIVVNGFQWGSGPLDSCGCSSQTWRTKHDAEQAYFNRAIPATSALHENDIRSLSLASILPASPGSERKGE